MKTIVTTRIFFLLSLVLAAFAFGVARAQTTTNTGGCTIVELGNVSQPKPSLDAFCSRFPTSIANKRFAELYGSWAPPILAGAWDDSERSFCGTPGCATANEHVRIILVANGQVNAGNFAGRDYGDILITSGLLDFVESSSRGLVADMASGDANGTAATDGYVQMLAAIRQNGGKACEAIVPMPAVNLSKEQLKAEIIIAQAVYRFVFGHELAHMQSAEARCGYVGSDPLALEESCDRISMEKILVQGTSYPPAIIAFLVALNNYEKLQSPILDAMLADPSKPGDLKQTHLTRNWDARAALLVNQWEQACSGGLKSQLGCLAQWKAYVAVSRRWMALPEPNPCRVAVPASGATN